jgi:hypothetical protein
MKVWMLLLIVGSRQHAGLIDEPALRACGNRSRGQHGRVRGLLALADPAVTATI